MAQCSEAESCPRDRRGMGRGGGSIRSTVSMRWQWQWLHRALILQAVTRRHQHSMADECYDSFAENMPISACRSKCWTLTTVHFLKGCVRDYQGVIMGTRRFACQGPIDYNYWVPLMQHVSVEEKDNHSSFHCLCLPSLSFFLVYSHRHIHAVMNAIHY